LIWCSYDLPEIGLLSSPIHQHIVPDYILGSRDDIGIPNIVTSVLASYRGYDTFGETIVVFTAGVAVLVLLKNNTNVSKQKNKKSNRKIG
jgi:multicomponent Na+:H+ antiporter subunit B